jgi:hypothetical protein
VRLRIVWHRGQALASAEIIAPHARHDVILAMTLLRDRHSFAGLRSGICVDAKWFGDRLQLAGCRQAHQAREAILFVMRPAPVYRGALAMRGDS